MSKIFFKIFKIFFIFVSIIVIMGVVLTTIKNYMIPEVEYTNLKSRFYVKERYYFTGKVMPKSVNVIEIKATKDMVISDINVKAGQILGNEKRMLFTLNTDNYLLESNNVLEEYNDEAAEINDQISATLKEISKKVGREIKNINELNPYDGIIILAPSDGKITGLSIEQDKKLNSDFIANITDDSGLVIPFNMTTYEYSIMSVGQEVLVTYSGYEGYYKGKVVSINPNAIPGKDKISYIYTGVIEAENPGLISPGVNVGISTSNDGQPGVLLSSAAVIESYLKQDSINSPLFFNNKDIYATEVNVSEGELVKKGQQIARLGGEDVVEELNLYIKNVKDKFEKLSKVQKNIHNLYSDIIKSNIDNNIRIDENGICSISEKIYIEYVTDKSTLRKDDVILRYRPYGPENLIIKTNIDEQTYIKANMPGNSIRYGGKSYSFKAIKVDDKRFEDYYEVSFPINEGDEYDLNDEVRFEITLESFYGNAAPKTAIVPIGDIKVGAKCYVYIIAAEDTMFGDIEVIQQKTAFIQQVGEQVVQLRFIEDIDTSGQVYLVNYINTILKDGMRVKRK